MTRRERNADIAHFLLIDLCVGVAVGAFIVVAASVCTRSGADGATPLPTHRAITTPAPVAILTATATPTPTPTATATPMCPSVPLTGRAAELFAEINEERVARHLQALSANGCATHVAQLRADDMAARQYFSHTSPTGDTVHTLLGAGFVPYDRAEEALARNNYPPAVSVSVAIDALMASPGHRSYILDANWSSMGVAVAYDATDYHGMQYFTMVFITA